MKYKIKLKQLECCNCGTIHNVKMVEDPYLSEIKQDYKKYPLCNDCVVEIAMEI